MSPLDLGNRGGVPRRNGIGQLIGFSGGEGVWTGLKSFPKQFRQDGIVRVFAQEIHQGLNVTPGGGVHRSSGVVRRHWYPGSRLQGLGESANGGLVRSHRPENCSTAVLVMALEGGATASTWAAAVTWSTEEAP